MSIHQRSLQNLALEIIKVKKKLAPEIMMALFFSNYPHYKLRNKSDFKHFNNRCVLYGIKTPEKSVVFHHLLQKIPHQ